MQLCAERPRESPFHLRTLRHEPADSLERRPHRAPSILFQDWIHNPPSPRSAVCPAAKTHIQLQPQRHSSPLRPPRGRRDLTHIVLNGDNCRVQVHLQSRHLTAVLQTLCLLVPASNLQPQHGDRRCCGTWSCTPTDLQSAALTTDTRRSHDTSSQHLIQELNMRRKNDLP